MLVEENAAICVSRQEPGGFCLNFGFRRFGPKNRLHPRQHLIRKEDKIHSVNTYSKAEAHIGTIHNMKYQKYS